MARYFFLRSKDFDTYLSGAMSLQTLLDMRQTFRRKFELVDFTTNCAAWDTTMFYAYESAKDADFRRKWTENICVFFALVGMYGDDPAYYSYLAAKADDLETFVGWLDTVSGPLRRLIFHALLFTLRPVEYAQHGGVFSINPALFDFTYPDRHIKYPEFAFDVIFALGYGVDRPLTPPEEEEPDDY